MPLRQKLAGAWLTCSPYQAAGVLAVISLALVSGWYLSERRGRAQAKGEPEDLPLTRDDAPPEQAQTGRADEQLVERPDAVGTCPEGMIEVEGDYSAVVAHVCQERLDGPVERCAEYATGALTEGKVEHKHFCVDRFEYPNLEGVRPVVMVSWVEAKAACRTEGKRLCTASEWTLACEGRERLPYPYGYRRDDTACNIDRPHPTPDERALDRPRDVSSEVARLDQRVSSGEMSRCTSPFGVQDMTGNVDEWVLNEQHFGPAKADGSERPFISALKGGYWGPVRNRCRATTTAHNESFRYYQVGFRCCADAP
jgi:sulfatase modifying factor 1